MNFQCVQCDVGAGARSNGLRLNGYNRSIKAKQWRRTIMQSNCANEWHSKRPNKNKLIKTQSQQAVVYARVPCGDTVMFITLRNDNYRTLTTEEAVFERFFHRIWSDLCRVCFNTVVLLNHLQRCCSGNVMNTRCWLHQFGLFVHEQMA